MKKRLPSGLGTASSSCAWWDAFQLLEILSGERTAASATAGGVRIVEGEARTHDAVDVINLNVFEVLRAEHVDEDSQPARFDNLVIGLRRFFDVHRILEAGASAGHDAHAQTAVHPHFFRI